MRRPPLVTIPAQRDSRGCARLGPLHDFVQRLEQRGDARSLHHLTGELHAAGTDETARRSWVRAMRERFAATQAASFVFDLELAQDDVAWAEPMPLSQYGAEAARAMKATLQEVPVGEAVVYTAAVPDAAGPRTPAGAVSAVGVRCSPGRGVAFALLHSHEPGADAHDLVQDLAATVWHLLCADQATGRTAGLPRSLSPLDLLQLLPLPSLITDGAGRALERNEAFGHFMESIGLRTATGRLRFDDPYLQDAWQVALSEVDVTAVRQSLVVASEDGRQWHMHLVPLHCGLDVADPVERALILAVVEQQGAPMEMLLDAAAAETARPLTPAEHEVLTALLQGHTAKVIANARGASVNTVRSQIMAILGKTGHHNQKALMAAFAPSGFRSSVSAAPGELRGTSSQRPGAGVPWISRGPPKR